MAKSGRSEMMRGNTNTMALAILRDGPTHGYAIAMEIARRSENVVEFKQGTLYPLLHELEREGFITSDWEVSDTDRPKRVYQITTTGLEELDRRLTAWFTFSNAMRRITGAESDGKTS